MAVDWLKIKNDYINGLGSYRKLAAQYNVPLRTIAKHAKDEDWQKAKEANCNSIATFAFHTKRIRPRRPDPFLLLYITLSGR